MDQNTYFLLHSADGVIAEYLRRNHQEDKLAPERQYEVIKSEQPAPRSHI